MSPWQSACSYTILGYYVECGRFQWSEARGNQCCFRSGCAMGPSIDDSYRFLAACYLREQVKQLATELVGVRESIDIEHIHQARVASRRLRAALGLFGDCLPQTMVQPWRKAIRRITTELGTARDCDVHAQELAEQLAV